MKITINHTLWAFLMLVLAANSIQAQQCSTRTTAGRYLVRCDGFLTPGPNAPQLPAKTLATATADKNGNFNGSGTVSVGGVTVTQMLTAPSRSTRTAPAPSLTRKPSMGSRARPLISFLWSPKAATRSTDW